MDAYAMFPERTSDEVAPTVGCSAHRVGPSAVQHMSRSANLSVG